MATGESIIRHDAAAKVTGRADQVLENIFETAMVQHCHLENHIVFAYMDDLDRIVIITSTQIPHIVRRIVGDALNFPLSRIKVIKPYIDGGFGNKQDVIFEPMAAFLTLKLNGRPVGIHMSREQCMTGARVRHPFHIRVKTGIKTTSAAPVSGARSWISRWISPCARSGSGTSSMSMTPAKS